MESQLIIFFSEGSGKKNGDDIKSMSGYLMIRVIPHPLVVRYSIADQSPVLTGIPEVPDH